jgi:hypothetical protein
MIKVYKNIPGTKNKDGGDYKDIIITAGEQFGAGNNFIECMASLMTKGNTLNSGTKDIIFDSFTQHYTDPNDNIIDLVTWAKNEFSEEFV